MNKKDLEEGKKLNLQFNKRGGLLPVIVQDNNSLEILMLGYINEEAFQITLKKRLATFWSTSRKEIWTKGETSGDYLSIVDIKVDCDQDAIIYLVKQEGKGSCHTKDENGNTRNSCFYRSLSIDLNELKKNSDK